MLIISCHCHEAMKPFDPYNMYFKLQKNEGLSFQEIITALSTQWFGLFENGKDFWLKEMA